MDLSSLGLPAVTGSSAVLATATVAVVDQVKKFLCLHVKGAWTAKLPSWLWYALALAIPTAICVVTQLDWIQSFVTTLSHNKVSLNLGNYGSVVSGLLIGTSASGTYKAKELAKSVAAKLGATVPLTYSPGGPNDCSVGAPGTVTSDPQDNPPVVNVLARIPQVSYGNMEDPSTVAEVPCVPTVLEPPVPTTPSQPTVRLFMELAPQEGPARWVLLEDAAGQHLYPVSLE